MGKKVVIKTLRKHFARALDGSGKKVLRLCWREPYEEFPVREDGTVEELSVDHPRFTVLKYEWKLEVIEVEDDKKSKPQESVIKDDKKSKPQESAKEVQ